MFGRGWWWHKRTWVKVWPGRYRLTVTLERAVGTDHRPRIERIRQSLTAQYADGRLTLEQFEHKMGRAIERHEAGGA